MLIVGIFAPRVGWPPLAAVTSLPIPWRLRLGQLFVLNIMSGRDFGRLAVAQLIPRNNVLRVGGEFKNNAALDKGSREDGLKGP